MKKTQKKPKRSQTKRKGEKKESSLQKIEPKHSSPLPLEFDNLTGKQKDFVLFYCESGNASASARKAGYSLKTAHAIGSENLKKQEIKDAIQAFKHPIIDAAGVSTRKLVDELTKFAFGDLKDFARIRYNTKGDVIGADLHLRDKLSAIKMLGEHIGMFTEHKDEGDKPPSINLHWHEGITGEEARVKLLEYLRRR